jgi:hypothetical protein
MIRKIKGGYRVVAETGRNMGTYRGPGAHTRAKKRLGQIEMFKHLRAKSPKGTRYLPPFLVIALLHGKDPYEKVIGSYPTRAKAERVASEGSREDQFSHWYEVRARTDAHSPEEWYWVTIYKGGWLKDAQLRGSYEPPDQRARHMSYRKVPSAFRQGVRANQSPRSSPQSIATAAQHRAVTSPFLRLVIRTMAIGEKSHVEPHGVLERVGKEKWTLSVSSEPFGFVGDAKSIYHRTIFYLTHGRLR